MRAYNAHLYFLVSFSAISLSSCAHKSVDPISRSIATSRISPEMAVCGCILGDKHSCSLAGIEVFNKNGAKPTSEYKNANSRPLHIYGDHLGNEFKNRVDDKNVRWLDSGGGYGMAGLGKSLKNANAHVTIINSQNNWAPILNWRAEGKPAYLKNQKLLLGGLMELGKNIDDIVSVINDRPIFADRWDELALDRLGQSFNEAKSLGRFDYRVGFVEEVLPGLREKYSLITDLFGAYYYSGNRLELIEQYYDHLSQEGDAFIVISAVDNRYEGQEKGWTAYKHGPVSKVEMLNGQALSFEQYLATQYPSVFQIIDAGNGTTTETKVLLMKKDPNLESLNLRSLLVEVRKYFPETEDGFSNELPTVEYKVRSEPASSQNH